MPYVPPHLRNKQPADGADASLERLLGGASLDSARGVGSRSGSQPSLAHVGSAASLAGAASL